VWIKAPADPAPTTGAGRHRCQRCQSLGAASLLDLTPARARVATGLAQGRTLEQMAAASRTRVVTVRSHLASEMQRVGARSCRQTFQRPLQRPGIAAGAVPGDAERLEGVVPQQIQPGHAGIVEQFVDGFKPEAGHQAGGFEQRAQPGVIVRPAVAVGGAAAQVVFQPLCHLVQRTAMLQQRAARDAVHRFGGPLPVQPVGRRAHQRAPDQRWVCRPRSWSATWWAPAACTRPTAWCARPTLGLSAEILVGHLVGAGRLHEAHRLVRRLVGRGLLVAAGVSLLAALLGRWLMGWAAG